MNILIIHEVDWLKKVTYEMHHLSEIFSLLGNKVYAMDVADPGIISFNNIPYKTIHNYHRIYDNASITLFRTPVIPIKGINRISAYCTSYRYVKKILKDEKIDVVLLYSVTIANGIIKACKEMKTPIIHRTFDIIHDLIREKYLKNFVLKIEKSVYPQFDKVIANTEFMKKWAEDMGARNVSIITQGVDSNIIRPISKDRKLQHELGIQDNDKVVMYLGSIESFSGLDFLIDKLPLMIKKNSNLKLLIVGGGSYMNKLIQQSKRLDLDNKVIFTGYVPYTDLPRYCSLSLLCINTFQINEMTDKLSPVKVFDLQACGKPILATPLKGLLFDFPQNQCGLVYAQLEEFPSKIIDMIQDEQNLEMIGNRGLGFIEKNFTWKKAAEKWIKEFKNIANN
jgi:glycosyltransferase involved in cell wall biosynthesis